MSCRKKRAAAGSLSDDRHPERNPACSGEEAGSPTLNLSCCILRNSCPALQLHGSTGFRNCGLRCAFTNVPSRAPPHAVRRQPPMQKSPLATRDLHQVPGTDAHPAAPDRCNRPTLLKNSPGQLRTASLDPHRRDSTSVIKALQLRLLSLIEGLPYRALVSRTTSGGRATSLGCGCSTRLGCGAPGQSDYQLSGSWISILSETSSDRSSIQAARSSRKY